LTNRLVEFLNGIEVESARLEEDGFLPGILVVRREAAR